MVADDLVLEQLKVIRRDMATKDDLSQLRRDWRVDLEALRGEMIRHFGEVETRLATEVHELIATIRELLASRDRLAARVTQLELDVQALKRSGG